MNSDVVIIGGGLAGLGAAVELASQGIPSTLLEQRPYLGGRTHSIIHEPTGDSVDNGQHLMMGCYHATRRLLKTVDAERLVHLQPNLRIPFLHPRRSPAVLKCPSLPAPLHLLVGMLTLSSLSFADRLKLMRVGMEIRRDPAEVEPRLASQTVHQWLDALGQSDENKKYLWDIIAVGSLNDDPKEVSALLFYRVLRSAFLGERTNASLVIPRVGLSDLFVKPIQKYLAEHGCDLRVNAGVKEVVVEASRVTKVNLADGSSVEGKVFVIAVPWFAAGSLFEKGPLKSFLSGLSTFTSSPIISINLWFDRAVMDDAFAALLDSRVQWVFNRAALTGSSRSERQFLTLVISGAAAMAEMSNEELTRVALDDLSRVLPRVQKAHLLHSLVVKEKRATFSPRPEIERQRPSASTPVGNLFLAGDWTDTGYPSTIEGAILSGQKAAAHTIQHLQSRPA